MAVLNNIRKHGIFLIIIIALALFAFVLADVIRNGGFSSGKDRNVIATINGQDIGRVEFSNRLQIAQQNSGGNLSTIQGVNQVWNTLLRQTLLKEQIETIGIDVGTPQITSALSRIFWRVPAFLTNGQFDVNKFTTQMEYFKKVAPRRYLQMLNAEEQATKQAKANVYFDLLAAGINTTPADIKASYQLYNTNFDVQYVRLSYFSVEDNKVKVTDADIQQYINNHKKEYTTKGYRDIRYVLFPQEASPTDVQNIKQSLAKLLEDHKVFNEAAGMEENAKGFRNVTDYESYLAQYSDIPYNNVYQFKSDLSKKYADSLFDLHKGQILGPYKDDGYWKYSKLVDQRQMPDSVKVEQILISYKGLQTGQGLERTRAEAEVLADSLLKVIKGNHSKFAELAKKYSNDPTSKEKGGETSWLRHPAGQTNAYIDYIFTHKPGSLDVIDTKFGYILVSIKDVKNEQKVIKLATLAKKIEPSEETQNALFNKATKFQIAVKDGDFAKIAHDNSYKIRVAKSLLPLDENVIGLGNHRDIVQWAYKETTKPGDIKRFNLVKGYVVAQLTASTTKGIETVKEAKNKVRPILLKKKKGEYLAKQIKSADLNKIAAQYDTQIITKDNINFKYANISGYEPKVVGSLFSLKEGQVSAPIAGKDALYVVKLIKRHNPEALKSYSGLLFRENKKEKQAVGVKVIKTLKDEATIVDRRAKFY